MDSGVNKNMGISLRAGCILFAPSRRFLGLKLLHSEAALGSHVLNLAAAWSSVRMNEFAEHITEWDSATGGFEYVTVYIFY